MDADRFLFFFFSFLPSSHSAVFFWLLLVSFFVFMDLCCCQCFVFVLFPCMADVRYVAGLTFGPICRSKASPTFTDSSIMSFTYMFSIYELKLNELNWRIRVLLLSAQQSFTWLGLKAQLSHTFTLEREREKRAGSSVGGTNDRFIFLLCYCRFPHCLEILSREREREKRRFSMGSHRVCVIFFLSRL